MEKNYFSHRLLVFICSTSFIFLFLSFLQAIISTEKNPQTNPINLYVYIVIFVSGILFILIQHLFGNEKSTVGNHVRFMIIYLIAILVPTYFTKFRMSSFFIFVSLILEYFISNRLHQMFLLHQIFVNHCKEKTGQDLIEHLFHDNLFIKDLSMSIKKIQTTLFVLGFFSAVFILILKILKISLTLNILISFFIFFLSVFFIYLIIGFFNKETNYATLGLTETLRNKGKLLRTCCFIILISLFLALIFSSNKSLIDVTKFPKFADKLEQRNYRKNFNMLDPSAGMAMDLGKSLANLDTKPWISEDVINLILNIFKFGLIGIAAIFLIFKFFQPFFSLGWKRFWQESHLYKFFKTVFGEISDFFRFIFLHEKKSERYSTVSSRNFLNSMQEVIKKSSRSKKKKLELDRLTRQFVKLINFGESLGYKYKKSFGPLEYTLFFNLNSAEQAGILFEKALYSKDTLTEVEENQFVNFIKETVATKNS